MAVACRRGLAPGTPGSGPALGAIEVSMERSRGFTIPPVPLTVAAALAGLAAGMGAFAFHYARGASYLGNDPATCANCHVMSGHYDGWLAAPHHLVATCNDCHTPAGPVSKYVVKAENGWHHSLAFTLGDIPDVIRARPESREVVEANCRHCHADLIDGLVAGQAAGPAHGGGLDCIRCHASVGHLR